MADGGTAADRASGTGEGRRVQRRRWPSEAGRRHLARADPVLAGLIAARPDFDPRAWMADLPPLDAFAALVFQIAGQQLSVAATRRIVERLQDAFDGHLPSPDQVLRVDPAVVRGAGLSGRKVATVRALATAFTDGTIDAAGLRRLSDDEIERRLTAIPGIGPWTVQGFLVIALDRPDVVLAGDLALRRTIRRVYQLDHLPDEAEVRRLAEPWHPYRSLATAYLFQAAFGDDGGRPAGRPARPSPARTGRSPLAGRPPPEAG